MSIINTSFTTNTFPEAWKLAEVTKYIAITRYPITIDPFHYFTWFCQFCQKLLACLQTITNFSLKGTFDPETGRKLKQHHSTETTYTDSNYRPDATRYGQTINRDRLWIAYTSTPQIFYWPVNSIWCMFHRHTVVPELYLSCRYQVVRINTTRSVRWLANN